MKTLCLMRHALASRRMDLQDFDRPLAPAGLDAAHGLILDTNTFDIADRCRDCGILYDDVTEECEQVRAEIELLR